MKLIILVIVQLVCMMAVLSCKVKKIEAPQQSYDCSNCLNYKMYIQNNWKKDSAGYYYFADLPKCDEKIHGNSGVSYTRIIGRNCLIGSNVDSIKNLFGQPSKEFQNRFDYYMNANCQGTARGDSHRIPGCIRVQVYFDVNRKIVGVGGMGRE